MLRLKDDLLTLLNATCDGQLDTIERALAARYRAERGDGARGYPGGYRHRQRDRRSR